MLLVLVVQNCKGEYVKILQLLVVQGYIWVCIDGDVCDLLDLFELDLYKKYIIEVVIDCFKVCDDL